MEAPPDLRASSIYQGYRPRYLPPENPPSQASLHRNPVGVQYQEAAQSGAQLQQYPTTSTYSSSTVIANASGASIPYEYRGYPPQRHPPAQAGMIVPQQQSWHATSLLQSTTSSSSDFLLENEQHIVQNSQSFVHSSVGTASMGIISLAKASGFQEAQQTLQQIDSKGSPPEVLQRVLTTNSERCITHAGEDKKQHVSRSFIEFLNRLKSIPNYIRTSSHLSEYREFLELGARIKNNSRLAESIGNIQAFDTSFSHQLEWERERAKLFDIYKPRTAKNATVMDTLLRRWCRAVEKPNGPVHLLESKVANLENDLRNIRLTPGCGFLHEQPMNLNLVMKALESAESYLFGEDDGLDWRNESIERYLHFHISDLVADPHLMGSHRKLYSPTRQQWKPCNWADVKTVARELELTNFVARQAHFYWCNEIRECFALHLGCMPHPEWTSQVIAKVSTCWWFTMIYYSVVHFGNKGGLAFGPFIYYIIRNESGIVNSLIDSIVRDALELGEYMRAIGVTFNEYLLLKALLFLTPVAELGAWGKNVSDCNRICTSYLVSILATYGYKSSAQRLGIILALLPKLEEIGQRAAKNLRVNFPQVFCRPLTYFLK